MKSLIKRLMPPSLYRGIVKHRYRLDPSPLDPWRRLSPDAPDSNSRGLSVDRYYIESFLDSQRTSIRGVVLELADDSYTKKFGSGVSHSDVLTDPRSGATSGMVGDLREPGTLRSNTYDCVILTQTLQFIDTPLIALANLYDALKPAGTLLITVPGIAQRDRYDDNLWGDYFRWMPRGFEQLMVESKFGSYRVEGLGNVLSATAFLNNLAIDDLKPAELSYTDRDFPLIVTCAAEKAA